MLTGDLINTVMNISAFCFLGALVWVFAKPSKRDKDDL